MEFYNPDKGCYCLSLHVLRDMDSTTFLSYRVDQLDMKFPISNQGYYTIYLNQFSFCKIADYNDIKIKFKKWNKENSGAIQGFRESLLETPIDTPIFMENLYKDLPLENTERVYHIFKRLLQLTKQCKKNKDIPLQEKVIKELEYLVLTEYSGEQNYVGNWWVYEIGIPRCLNEMLILLYEDLPKEKICWHLAVENFYIPEAIYTYYRRNYPDVKRLRTNYANLADTIYICLLRNILWQNEEEIQRLYLLLPELISVTNQGNGFHLDGGFVYHDTIPYNASYGEVLLHSITKILELYYYLGQDCTSYLNELYALIEKSYLPFLYHQRALDCVRGRAISRKADCHYSFQTILSSLRRLAKLFTKQGFIDLIYNEEEFFFYTPRVYAFNSMNRYIKRNNSYLLAISAYSNTIANYESINGENLLGYYQSNFTYDLYYNQSPEQGEVLKINPYFRNGSTNPLLEELPNQVMENRITAGITMDSLLSTCFHQNNKVQGYFTKLVLENSLLAIGTNISSSFDYVSTIFTFEGNFIQNKNTFEGKEFLLYVRDLPVIENKKEKRSFHDLNRNEKDEPKTFSVTRFYYKNPKDYVYQLYPQKNCLEDEYELSLQQHAHIITYKSYLFVNIFQEDCNIEYEGMCIQGCVCLVLKKIDSEILIRLAAGHPRTISISIPGFTVLKADIKTEKDLVVVEDDQEHTLLYRRDL